MGFYWLNYLDKKPVSTSLRAESPRSSNLPSSLVSRSLCSIYAMQGSSRSAFAPCSSFSAVQGATRAPGSLHCASGARPSPGRPLPGGPAAGSPGAVAVEGPGVPQVDPGPGGSSSREPTGCCSAHLPNPLLHTQPPRHKRPFHQHNVALGNWDGTPLSRPTHDAQPNMAEGGRGQHWGTVPLHKLLTRVHTNRSFYA